MLNRRKLIHGSAFIAAAMTTPGIYAEELVKTAESTEGPFYPDKLPLDTDNDLLIINDSITPGVGQITHLNGKILSPLGSPIRNAFVEIWQCDNNGAYGHAGSGNADKRDSNFQGYGRFLTDSKGNYYFRTIKPVPYPGRTPHIHIAVSLNGHRVFTSQILIKDSPLNQRDGVWRNLKDDKARNSLVAAFNPIKGSPLKELEAEFDVVLGQTAEEHQNGKIRGGIGKRQWRSR
ncbi:MAG: protocatechuate 3,4-dioxygenase [Planctomycetota bacterium]|nr:protocatechuate 3,4-dioxygenase [Planctomycetota bacterium]